jgi:HNH endonuclease
MASRTVYPERTCDQCGLPLHPYHHANGKREALPAFLKRRFCSRLCANRGKTYGPYTTDEKRFWTKVEKTDSCWLWTAAKDPKGYGRFFYTKNGKRIRSGAHQYAYIRFVGPIPPGHELDHLCRNRACVRPDHLEVVTHGDNVRRGLQGNLRTHCPRGHPLDGGRTPGNSQRYCLTCKRESSRRSYRKRRTEN